MQRIHSTTMTAPAISPAARFTGLAAVALVLAAWPFRAGAQTTVLSTPVGVITEDLSPGLSGKAFPLHTGDIFVGVAEANTGHTVTFPGPDLPAGTLVAGRRYFLEVTTGPLEGERLDLDTEATLATSGPQAILDFGTDTHSTLGAVPADALIGARCVVRAHVTLGDLPAMFTPALAGDRRVHRSDAVSLLDGDKLETYSLAADGASWHDESGRHLGVWALRHRAWSRRHGAAPAPTDYRDMVIPPDTSVVLHLRSGAKRWMHEGLVRTNAFRKNLARGVQAFASGFPMDLSPAQIGAYADPSEPAGNRWYGNNLFLVADQIDVLFSSRLPLDVYFLRGDGKTWQALLRSPREDFSQRPILGQTDAIVIRRRNPDNAFVIPRPFDL